MYCSNCGKEVADDAKFCKYCGHSLADESVGEATISTSTDNVNKTEDAKPMNMDTSNLMEGTLNEKQKKRVRARKKREIEDARALDNYTIKDDMVREASVISRDRIHLTNKGSIAKLKTREILLIVLFGVLMIASTAIIAVIHNTHKATEDSMSALVIIGYFLFFVIFFALAFGIDRIYNLLTLNELAVRRITLKKFGFRLCPLALIDGNVYAVEIEGECDLCDTDPKGSFHLEWQGDELIAVCNFNRKHIHKVNIADILGEDNDLSDISSTDVVGDSIESNTPSADADDSDTKDNTISEKVVDDISDTTIEDVTDNYNNNDISSDKVIDDSVESNNILSNKVIDKIDAVECEVEQIDGDHQED